MSLQWDEKTLSAFYENTKKAILKLNGHMKELSERSSVNVDISEDTIRSIVEKYIGDGDDTLSQKMSKFMQMADEIQSSVMRVQKSAIAAVKQEYYLSNSPAMLTGGSWAETPPAWQDGKYIWVRSVITQANGDITYDSAVCITGNTGESGVGDGIQSYTAYYKTGDSASVKPENPSAAWATTPPAVTENTYLWVAYLVTYTSGKAEWTEPYCATDAIVRGEIKKVRSEITELADSITLEVTDGTAGNTARIKLKVNDKEYGGTIDLTGMVTFTDLNNASSKTKINGGNIDTETLFARDVKATGKLQVENTWWSLLVGEDNGITMKAWKKLYLKGGTDVEILSEAGNIILSCMNTLKLDGREIVMTKCPKVEEAKLFSNAASGVSITAGSWQTLASVSLSPGTYIIRGTLTVYHSSAFYITSLRCGSDELAGSRNTTQCNGGNMYVFGQSVGFITLTETTTVSLIVYGSEESAYALNAAYIEALKVYNN